MRYFNPASLTEVLPGVHDMAGAVELPDENWFFTTQEIPEGMRLAVNENGEPVLVEVSSSEEGQAS